MNYSQNTTKAGPALNQKMIQMRRMSTKIPKVWYIRQPIPNHCYHRHLHCHLITLGNSRHIQIQSLRVLPKYDILSYAVGAKDHELVPEEIYYNKTANENEFIKIMYGKLVYDEQQGVQSDQRLTSLKRRDLSSMVSHTDCWDRGKLRQRPADYRRRVLCAWCLWQACWNQTILKISSWSWRKPRNTMLPWQRSCRIIWRHHSKREMKTFWLSTLGNCSWRLHQCFMHLSLCCCAYTSTPSPWYQVHIKKKARAWTGFNWPLQCCLQQIRIF